MKATLTETTEPGATVYTLAAQVPAFTQEHKLRVRTDDATKYTALSNMELIRSQLIRAAAWEFEQHMRRALGPT